MGKNEYLRTLARELRKLPKEEFDTAMDYYTEYFEDAGPEKEQEIIQELGTPREVAYQIITDAAIKRMEEQVNVKKGFSTLWIIILGICAAPVALPMAFAMVALFASMLLVVVAFVGSAILVDLCALAGGIVTAFCGIYLLFTQPATGIALLGLGMAAVGIGIFVGFGIIGIGRRMVKGIGKMFRNILKRRKKS
ncbi:DUF1700 domain-containing protein [Robinsoniella peoriensis]|uniref:DUF1700 domain-containing protein n=1 Tax=Robinsoniella peoriensis TaxID=180332 RepID=UPI003626DD31